MKVMWVFLGVGTTMFIAGALLIYLGLAPTLAVEVVASIGAAAAQVTERLPWRRDYHGQAGLTATADERPDAKPADDQNSEPGSTVA